MPGVTQQATLGSRSRFLMIFNGFGVPIWSPIWSSFGICGPLDPPITAFGSQGRIFLDLGCKSCWNLMPECYENLVDIDVFMRFPFSVFSVIWACKLRLWDLILEALEGPGLPYRPPGHAMLQTGEIHDFQAPPES